MRSIWTFCRCFFSVEISICFPDGNNRLTFPLVDCLQLVLLAQFLLLLQYLRLQEEKEIAREVQRPFDEYKYRVFQLLCYEFCPEDLPINKVNLKKKTEVIFLSSAVPAGGGGGTHHLVSLVTGDPDHQRFTQHIINFAISRNLRRFLCLETKRDSMLL